MQWTKSGAKPHAKPHAKQAEYTTIIDEGSEIEGKFTFAGTVMVNGRLRGEIVSNDTLVVGDKGVINANIRAGVVLVSGEVVGDVTATERVELLDHCRMYGDVSAPVVIIEEGALFEGQCRMTKTRPVEFAQPALRDSSVVALKQRS